MRPGVDGTFRLFKAVKRTADPRVFASIHGGTIWRIGHTNLWKGAGAPKLCEDGFHACPNPAAPYVLNFGYKAGQDPMLEVLLEDSVTFDGVKAVGRKCTPLRIVPMKEWRRLVSVPSVLAYTNGKGLEYHTRYGKLHRADDLPAVLEPTGRRQWWKYGYKHRADDQPAVVVPGYKQEWWMHGRLHRDGNKPAVVWHSGTLEWWQNGVRERVF